MPRSPQAGPLGHSMGLLLGVSGGRPTVGPVAVPECLSEDSFSQKMQARALDIAPRGA
ncbi:MAG: hypothetical protein R3210_05060 [Roseovarius sp.]|nr:hypothetical protein [Roseovarius sp.]